MSSSPSRRPYLIRAIYEWATDNGYTPHLLVAADYEGVTVPRAYVQEGRITLNVSAMAVQSLDIQSDPIWFSARFAGRSHDICVPSGAVLAVFARENGEGIVFGEVEPTAESEAKPKVGVDQPGTDDDEPPRPPRPSGRPNLRVVK